MNRIHSLTELTAWREELANTSHLALQRHPTHKVVIRIGMATCGIAAGAEKILVSLKEEIAKHELNEVLLVPTGCLGQCYAEPLVEVETLRGSVLYGNVTENMARDIINRHVIGHEILDHAVIGRGSI